MKATKRERLRRAGFQVGSAADFLGLDDEERALLATEGELARQSAVVIAPFATIHG